MENEKIEIIDDSGDKGYFTIVPNYILNHSTADEQALYLQMKRLAGEKGQCFATLETLAGKLHWKEFSVRTNIKKLLKRKWIEKAGTIQGKTHPINAYKIVDIWSLNIKTYKEKKEVSNHAISEKTKRREPQTTVRREPQTTAEEEPIIKEDLSIPKGIGENPPTLSSEVQLVYPKKGNNDVNELTDLLKDKFNLKVLDGTIVENRRYCWLAIKKFKRAGVELIINVGSQDEFWQNQITGFKNLYYKGVQIASAIKKKGRKVSTTF